MFTLKTITKKLVNHKRIRGVSLDQFHASVTG